MNKLYSLLAFLFFSQIYAVNFTVNNIRYTGSDNAPYTATVTGHTFSFFGAADLSTVTYNGNNYTVTSIGINAFSGSRYLTSVTIGHAVTSIGDFAFKSCTSLASVTIPNSVTSIGNSAFGSCNSLTSITIPNSVTSIGNAAFEYCTGLTYVTIGNSVTSIRYNAFFSCTSLTSVTIPNSVTSIESNVFSFCSSLTSVTIPNSVTSIGSQAFYNCTNLTTVNCYVLNPIAISADVFQIINQSACALNVPIGSEAAYEAAAVWTNFNPINGNLNIAPTDILLSASAINENKAANSTVGTFGSTDANTADTFTYTLVAGTGSTDNTSFNISGNTLTINASPDFETKSSYLIRVRTTDNGDLSFEKEFTITVNNVNEAPTDISLSASAINENVAGNSSVGIFSSIDADAANTFTYTLVAGTGSTDNASFNISGNSLRITASPDFETKSSYAIRIRTTDQGNLFFEKQFTVAINNLCDVSFTVAQTNVSCNGGSNGSATVTVSGGTSGYTYSWSPTGGTAATATGLTAGTYTCTITDANSCTTTASVTITQPNVMTVDAGPTTVTYCANAITPITATNISTNFQGAYAPANWAFANANADGNVNTTNAPASITITGGNNNGDNFFGGSPGDSSYSITFTPNTTVSFNWAYSTDDGGFSDYPQVIVNGVATIMQGYNINTSRPETQSGTMTVNVTAGQTFAFNMHTVDNKFGAATVTISNLVISNSDGSYSWVATNGGSITGATNTANMTPATSGTYTVTATNANGCSATDSVAVIIATATTSQTDVSCNGGSNGAINLTPTGGTAPYTFNWGGGITTEDRTGLAAGTYTCTITDASSCITTTSVTITEPTALVANLTTQTNVSCNGGPTGSATVSVSGGTSGYTYSWSPSGGTAATASGLAAGTYTCTITDANSCTTTASVTITQPTVIDFTTTVLSGYDYNTGYSQTIVASGGTGSKTYAVTAGSLPSGFSLSTAGQITGISTQIADSNFTVTATDANSCSATYDYILKLNQIPITVTATPSQTKVYGESEPVLTYTASPSLLSGDSFTGSLTRVSGKNIGNYAINQGSLSAGSKYLITYAGANFSITAKPITVTADAKTKVYGAVDPSLTYSVSPSLVGTDVFTGTLTRVSGENVSTYAIEQNDLSAGSNYAITYEAEDFAITAKPITVTADAKTKVYGAVDPSLTYSVSPSLVGTDGFTGTLTRVAGENVGTYAITQGDLSAGSNYTIAYVAKD
ncbi:SprB-like repeat protein, partial [Flavobacterium glaciei]